MDEPNSQLMEMESEMDENKSGTVFEGQGECEEDFSDYGNPDMEGDEEEGGEFDEEENGEDHEENPKLPTFGEGHLEFDKVAESNFGGETENPEGGFSQSEIKQELSDYDDENAEFEAEHLESIDENPMLDNAGSEGEHSEFEGKDSDVPVENPDLEHEHLGIQGEHSDIDGENPDADGENLDLEGEHSDFVGRQFKVAGRDDHEMEGSDFEEGEHPELEDEDEEGEYEEGVYPGMDDEDSRLEGDENLSGKEEEEDSSKVDKTSPLYIDRQRSANILKQIAEFESEAVNKTAESDETAAIGTSGYDIDNSNMAQISPKREPQADTVVEETNASSPSVDAFSIRKSLDLTRSLSTVEWSSSASPSKRDLASSPPGLGRDDDPRPTKRLKMQTMRTELDLKGSMMTRTWTELTNLLNDYQAELYQREDTLTSFENCDEKAVLEEMSALKDDLGSKDRVLSKCQEELRTKTERLKTVEAELIMKTDELTKVKQELTTRNAQVKKFEFDVRYLKNEHVVKDNLLKKVQDQMVRETREMAAQIQGLRESMEMEKRLAQSYKDMAERERKKRENVENRCRLLMSQSGGKVQPSIPMSASDDGDVIVIEDDEPKRANIRADIRHSRPAGSGISSFRQASPSSSLASLGHLSAATGVRRQSPVSSAHGSSIGGAQTSFMSSDSLASKTLSSSSMLHDSTRSFASDHKTTAPVISNVESLQGHSLSSPTRFEDSIMNPLRSTPERQDSFGEGSSMEMSQYVSGVKRAAQREPRTQNLGQTSGFGNWPLAGRSMGHQCPICNKRFVTPSKLARHIQSHTGERPHVCKYCNKAFRQKSHLHTHVVSVHTSEIQANLIIQTD
ncbi:uncharacterized protein LOC135488680 isoform X4 [Lineus longissimus]|uniref:uncharacterized protein LOC135488680 isoform X4 n=1 Tax=Lineus longissimus TaxID=88925 RepID=UPI00315D0403